MQLFQSYAQTTIIESSIFTTIQTLAGDLMIRALGSTSQLLTIASAGLINIQASEQIAISTLGTGDITLQTAAVSGTSKPKMPRDCSGHFWLGCVR
jgi:hypothetical protein